MLYFLHQLSDPPHSPALQEAKPSASNRLPSYQTQTSSVRPLHSPEASAKRSSDRQFVVDSPAFNEAFSQAGLLRLPGAEGPDVVRVERPVLMRRRERPKQERVVNTDTEAGVTEVLRNWSDLTRLEPTEPAMLRDLPFTLQGLSSTNFVFSKITTLQLPKTLPVPLIGLLHTLAEPCLLYKNLQSFVELSEGGLIGQSFRSALSIELRSYLGLVATLEGQIRRALAVLNESEPRQGIGKAGVTLKRCVVWTREATMGLRLMSLMVEESKG